MTDFNRPACDLTDEELIDLIIERLLKKKTKSEGGIATLKRPMCYISSEVLDFEEDFVNGVVFPMENHDTIQMSGMNLVRILPKGTKFRKEGNVWECYLEKQTLVIDKDQAIEFLDIEIDDEV